MEASQVSLEEIQGELEVNEAIISENDRDLQVIEEQMDALNEIFADLALLTEQQGERIGRMEEDIAVTNLELEEGLRELSSVQLATKTALFTLIGGLVAGPVGALCGIKSGLALGGLTVGGSAIGWMLS